MTKRSSPFEYNICRQSKIHLNDYENDIRALKEIQELTLKKLMEGSKKISPKDLNGKHQIQVSEHDNKSFMQKCVTDYFTINGMKINENGRRVVGCSEPISRCFFCEARTSAVYQCIQCSEFYCSTCSFVNYDSFENQRTCLSCS